jgi:GWxTD domain-containing protein
VTLLQGLVAAAVLAGLGGPQAGTPVEVTVKRFARGDQTLVDGFCRVAFDFLTPTTGGNAAYRLQVSVQDSAGLLLHESGWSQTVPSSVLEIPGGSTVEHFAFAVPSGQSGQYTVAVSVADSASGRVEGASVELEALERESRVSDLLLTGDMRRATEVEAAVGPGEVQKGRIFLSASTRPVLTPRQSELYYYLELYPGVDASVSLAARVFSADGSVVTSAAPQELAVRGTGGVTARSLSLAGLPEGEYRLEVVAQFPDGDVVRGAPFTMTGFDTEARIAQVTTARSSDPFATLTEQQADSLYGPLAYIMEADERGIYDDLSLTAKRNYLRQFWEKRDPTPGTPANEARSTYYGLFAEATHRFRESGAGDIPGWRTDRGRIFLKYGQPEDVLRRPEAALTPPYEVWKFTRPRMLKFVFLDETGLGNYALIYTDDRFEQGRADWERLLGAEAVQDVLLF